ncbi:MAG: hypothetical protein KGL42_17750, partial [Betaproteobacteria bacterium]|nr:hypothetical protein [Betaproteobacteria bacterium]
QMAFNMIWSAVLTNSAAFGVANVYTQRGSDVSVSALAGNLQNIEGNPGFEPPHVLDLSKNEAQQLELLNQLRHEGEIVSGVNSAARGEPDSAMKAASGRALGLLQAMAVQFNSALQASYMQFVQDYGNLALLIFRKFAQTKRVVQIVGKDKVVKSQGFSSASTKGVGVVVVENVNPMSKTMAGQREEAEFLVQNGLITTPYEYGMVAETGRINVLTDADQGQRVLIEQENQALMSGGVQTPTGPVPVPVFVTDKHEWHLPRHLALLNSPQVRINSPLVQGILAHVQEHQQFAAQMAMEAQQTLAPAQGGSSKTPAPKEGEQSSTLPQGTIPGGQKVDLPETAVPPQQQVPM